VELSDLSTRSGEWLRGEGSDADVVMSSRIRLARNVAGFPFASRASEKQRAETLARVRGALQGVHLGERTFFLDLAATPALDTAFLVERHLISRELAVGKGPRGVGFGDDERMSVMVNEEDHVRLQAIRSGLSLDDAWKSAVELDRALEAAVPWAVSPTYGYLTACPTNVGTGLRASVMLHLPALVYAKQIDRVFQAAAKTGLAVRGYYGEGTMASGDFYQISNQVTLGVAEDDILRSVSRMLPSILGYEREVRQHLLSAKRRVRLEDKVHRARALLRSARSIASEEAMELLSAVRLGVVLKLLDEPTLDEVNELFVLTQPAHLQKLSGREIEADERDVERADLLRKRLGDR
jgi:protein arginine kinase